MSCPFFKNSRDIGFCDAYTDSHIPRLDEMARICFKDDHPACDIFRRCIAIADHAQAGSAKHISHRVSVA